MKPTIYPVIACMLACVFALALAACSEDDNPNSPDGNDTAGYKSFTYSVINVFPHDGGAFTQGLVYVDGFLYEGTGLHGSSSLRKVQLETGAILQRYDLPTRFFGEGIFIKCTPLFVNRRKQASAEDM